MSYSLIHGDVLDQLRGLPENYFDGSLTDPPYGLSQGKKGGCGTASENLNSPAARSRATTGFMGLAWDARVPGPEVWTGILRVLKPGAFLLAFGGARTHHRLMCAIEDAGFEIRDVIMWIYGSGFPKTRTSLKPAFEPIVVAMKPCDGTFAQNLDKWGVGGLNISESRIEAPGSMPESNAMERTATNSKGDSLSGSEGEGSVTHIGRWPTNVIHDGSDAVLAHFPDAPGQLAEISNSAPSTKNKNCYGSMKRIGEPSADRRYSGAGSTNFAATPGERRTDAGSAARFFYCAKASASERNGNSHPTVKPVDLCRYLSKLILPPERSTRRRLIVPYSGSGSEMFGAMVAGWDEITGIEREAAYIEIAERRLVAHQPLFGQL